MRKRNQNMKKRIRFGQFTSPLFLLLALLLAVSCSSGSAPGVPTGESTGEIATEAPTQAPTEEPHTHTWTPASFVEPTLTAQGYDTETCTCGETRILHYTGLTGENEEANAVEHTVLFIGNSYTYYNDSPTIFEMIANGQGYSPVVKSVTKAAYYLRQFANPTDEYGKKVYAELDPDGSTAYDVVFLQEQTTNPALSPANFYTNVRILDRMIKEKGATTVLYQTWGRKTGNSVLTDNGWTNETMAYKIAASYEAIAEEIGAALSPAGSAFYDVYTNHPEIELYNADGSHPSLAGSYLAALCHYATVYGKSPIGVSFVPNGIPAEQALILQTAAHNAVFGASIVPESYRTSSVGVGS